MAIQRSQITWRGGEVSDALREGAARGILVGAEYLLTESRKVVPLDEGTLERSGTASVDEDELIGAVTYDTPYAVRQHEELNWRHAPGRQAKYLEQPARRLATPIGKLIAAQVRRATRS